ncbi:MAG: heavy-metal-associated domain-containing protein [Bordetella sp.]|nr:heavy-metal-associated domain-containing protein [Bordetella sp.]
MISLYIPKIRCDGCVAAVERAIRSIDPAAKVTADVPARRVEVGTTSSRQSLAEALAAAGYPVEG